MRAFTIIGGVNVAGKSSLSGVLSAENPQLGIIVDTDKLTAEFGGDRIKGGHDIPEDDVKRRYSKRFDDLAAILPYCNEVRFFDNENGFAEKAEYRNGSLITKGNNIPKWIEELKEYLEKNAV